MEQTSNPITQFLQMEPTSDQMKALDSIYSLFTEQRENDFLIIRGSAGTGKSTLIKAVSDYLTQKEMHFFLAAPTGKAAKVVQKKTGYSVRTIHSLIYKPEPLEHGCGVKMVRKQNQSAEPTIFIIDEASMISDVLTNNENFVASKPLLSDLLDYIKQGNGTNQVIFIGDVYQLPPIGSNDSPALSPNYLRTVKRLSGEMVELTEVKRQGNGSYILKNATLLRQCIAKGIPFPGIDSKMLDRSTTALRKYMELYDPESFNRITVLAWTNRDVNWFNSAIRDRLGYNPAPISIGDQLSLHTNWLGNGRMIMKGDSGIVRQLDEGTKQYAGLHFVSAGIEFTDSLGERFTVNSKILLESLTSPDGEIGYEKENALFAEVMKHNAAFRESRMPYDDEYIGAMHMRYGYAITCHKAQGGEWDNLILHPWIPKNDYRWQYTAVTRAAKELYSFAA
jgi:exodeoxyribonuclease-5